MKGSRLLVAAVSVAAAVGVAAPPTTGVAATSAPLWVKHVQNFSGGISNGVRFSLDPTVMQAQARYASSVARATTTATSLNNVQMNDDSYPPLPQNEESVAYSTDNPMVAVAGANDYVSGGTVVMRTSDGGRTWASTRVVPVFRPTSDICNGGDPAIAYSARDHAFYLSQLCFFRRTAAVRGPDLQVARQRRDVDARSSGGHRRDELRRDDGNGRHALVQRQGLHDDRQQPEQPTLRTAVRDVHPVPHPG